MRFQRFLIGSLLLFLMASSLSVAQTADNPQAQKDIEKRQELERKTLALLDETVTAAWGLKLPQNRSFVFENAADLLWTHDEKRARNLFWDAFNSLNPPTTPNDPNAKPSATEKAQTLNQYYAAFNLRQSFLRNVAQHDLQLALDMLHSTRLLPPQNLDIKYQLPDERDLEEEIANAAVARDPKKALQIARESLAKGLTFQLLGLLFELNRRDPNTASEFANDVIDKIESYNIESDVVAWRMSLTRLNLSRGARKVAANGSDNQESEQLKLTDDQKRTLVEKITDVALSASAKPDFVLGASEVMAEIEELTPDRAAKLKSKIATISVPKEQIGLRTYEFRNGTPQEMITAGTKLTPDIRNALDQQAVIGAVTSGKTDELRDFINSNVQEESRRKALLDSLDEGQITHAVSLGKLDELEKVLPLIRSKEHRGRTLAEMAIFLEKNGQHDEAVKLLDEAYGLVKLDLKSDTQSTALLTVLMGYALVDPPKAFAIIEPMVDRVNEEISKLLLVDKFFRTGIVSKGEIIVQQSGMLPVDFLVFKYGRGINALANADFNRTRALADRFQRNELRIMARLMLVKSLLHSPEAADTSQSSPVNLP